jgi:hypothetical protein
MICKKRIGNLLVLTLEHDIYDIENNKRQKAEYLSTIPCYKYDVMQSMYKLYGRAFLHGNYTYEDEDEDKYSHDENKSRYKTKNKIFIITNLFTNIEFRGMKYASQLLCRAIYEARRNNCKYIKLTDCTDLFQHSQNIYIKHRFRYDEVGSPEMTLCL